jgi:type I restriction enzyme M protein
VTKTAEHIQELSGFVWRIAEILRGDFKQSEYGKVVLPFVVLRRWLHRASQKEPHHFP